MLNKAIAAAALLMCAMSTHATDYYVVVPVKNRTPAQPAPAPDPIVVSLNARALPNGKAGVAYPGVDFRPLLQVTGDSTFTGAGVTWSVSQGSLPAGLSLDAAGWLSGTPAGATAGAGQTFQVTATYKSKSGSQNFTLTVAAADMRSCKDYLASNPGASSGWYQLDPDGAGPQALSSYYCDMTSDGGGWTRVVRQTEAQPVTNWNGGVNGSSYSLATAAIPPHTQVGFGKDELATDLDYVNGTYSSGDIATTLVTSPKTGYRYHMNRTAAGYFSGHDPELAFTPGTQYANTLTLNIVGSGHNWAFNPAVTAVAQRGYAYQGGRYSTIESYAWTVWVR